MASDWSSYPLTLSLRSLFLSRWPLHEEVSLNSVIALSPKSLQPGIGNSCDATSPELSNHAPQFPFTAISGKSAAVNKFFSDYLISWTGYSRISQLLKAPSLFSWNSVSDTICTPPQIHLTPLVSCDLGCLLIETTLPPPHTAHCHNCHNHICQHWPSPSLHQGECKLQHGLHCSCSSGSHGNSDAQAWWDPRRSGPSPHLPIWMKWKPITHGNCLPQQRCLLSKGVWRHNPEGQGS